MQTKISVIIASYNSEEFIEKCIKSVLENLPEDGELIVWDNASSDKTVEILQTFNSKIKLIAYDKNIGYSKANNNASKIAEGEFLFFLNPDTEIKEEIFDKLIEFYESDSSIGLVAPKLIMPDGRTQASVKKLPTVWGAFQEYVLGVKHAYSEYVPDVDKPVQVDAVYGAALLIKKDLYNRLKGFDEKYFIYYEDIDFCRRLKDIGKKIYYYPDVSINHRVGGTKSTKDKGKINYESSLKYHGLIATFLLQLIFRLHGLSLKLKK